MSTPSLKKKVFPAGIFLLLFVTETILAAGACLGYFLYVGRSRIHDIEKYTRNYSITMAEAFSRVAELSYRRKQFGQLASLFQEKIQENTIDQAFFVLKDGLIIIHSDKNAIKDLNGNIANDEFAYNLELILRPLKRKSEEIQFTDYNIVGKKVPFDRDLRMALKQYLYPSIDTTGWLVTRAVYQKGKPVGTVNFIIGKERIFSFVRSHIDDCITLFLIALGGSLGLSLFISLVVLVRYRGIQQRTMDLMRRGVPASGTRESDRVRPIPVAAPVTAVRAVPSVESDAITIELLPDGAGIRAARQAGAPFDRTRVIRDAIPIRKE